MPKPKENKNSPTRLPDELKVALRKEQAPYLARGEEPPSFGALLLEAWKRRAIVPQEKLSVEYLALLDTFTRFLQTENADTIKERTAFLKSWEPKHPAEEHAETSPKTTGASSRHKGKLSA